MKSVFYSMSSLVLCVSMTVGCSGPEDLEETKQQAKMVSDEEEVAIHKKVGLPSTDTGVSRSSRMYRRKESNGSTEEIHESKKMSFEEYARNFKYDHVKFPPVIDKIPLDSNARPIRMARGRCEGKVKLEKETITNQALFAPATEEEIKAVMLELSEQLAGWRKNVPITKRKNRELDDAIKVKRITASDLGYKKVKSGIEKGHVFIRGVYLEPPYRIEIDREAKRVSINGVDVCWEGEAPRYEKQIQERSRAMSERRCSESKQCMELKKRSTLELKYRISGPDVSKLPLDRAKKIIEKSLLGEKDVARIEFKGFSEERGLASYVASLRSGLSFKVSFKYGDKKEPPKPPRPKQIVNPEHSPFVLHCLDERLSELVAGLEYDLVICGTHAYSRSEMRKKIALLATDIEPYYKAQLLGQYMGYCGGMLSTFKSKENLP